MTAMFDEFIDETIEDALEAAVDYGFEMGRHWATPEEFEEYNKRLEKTVEQQEELFEDAAERLYLAVGCDRTVFAKKMIAKLSKLKRAK